MPTKSLGENASQHATPEKEPSSSAESETTASATNASATNAPEAETNAPEADDEGGMVAQLAQQLEVAQGEIERLTKACADQYLAMLAARDYSVGADARAGQYKGEVRLLKRQIEALKETIEALYERVAVREGEIESIRLSETWRIGQLVTHPLGPITKMIRKR